MKIVCDRSMPYAAEAFATLGEVALLPGRGISARDVRDASLLATRSTTRVDRRLLEGSAVRFYGSAVIGVDHIDIPYLESAGIAWTGAAGCNAESVANYVTAALLWLGGRHGFELAGRTLSVIGAGNVGRRVCAHAQALGLRVLVNDPPRQRNPHDADAQSFVSLDQALAEADMVTLHVPLTLDGPDATWHLLDASAMARMRPGAIVINAARGPVVETSALLAALGERVAHAALDCWEGEPFFDAALARRADLATPHIAGHSYEGKVNGSAIVYRRACAFFGREADYPFELPLPPVPSLRLEAARRSREDALRDLVLAVYDIGADSQRFKAVEGADDAERAAAFDAQRAQYPMRREFAATQVRLEGASPELLAAASGLGFRLAPA